MMLHSTEGQLQLSRKDIGTTVGNREQLEQAVPQGLLHGLLSHTRKKQEDKAEKAPEESRGKL